MGRDIGWAMGHKVACIIYVHCGLVEANNPKSLIHVYEEK